MTNQEEEIKTEYNDEIIKTLENPISKTNKFLNWFKDPFNSLLAALVIFTIVIRLYYFFITWNQPLWWDEAEYFQMARKWAFGIDYQIVPVRPVLLPFLITIFFKISENQLLPRLLELVISITSVLGVYYLGKGIYDKKVGLIAAFFMSVFYLSIFYTYRLLVDIPSMAFFTFSAFFIFKYFKSQKAKYIYIASILIGIGTLFRITTAILLLAVLIYLIFTEKHKFLLKKEIWISLGIFILILLPYIIWGYIQFNGFIITKAAAWNAPKGNVIAGGLIVLKNYISLFPTYLTWVLLIFFILGIVLLLRFLIGFDIMLKQKEMKLRGDFFIILLLIIPLIINSFSIQFNDDRYIFCSFPSIFIIASIFIMFCFNYIKKKTKILAIIFVIALLFFVAYSEIKAGDNLVKQKISSYSEIMDAGLFLNNDSTALDIIATSSLYQVGFYSKRNTINFPQTEKEFETLLKSNKNIKYYMISAYEKSPEWTYSYPQENNLTVVRAYFFDQAQTKPMVVIYKIK